MGWHARLALHYTREGDRTVAHDRHEGPLRVLQRLYPEGPSICHHVLVHPPGGVVGGDVLAVDARLAAGTHAVVTTPGATRFYRSDGPLAVQSATLRLDAGARLEWLPLEAIAYRGCNAENRVVASLADGAEAIGWDVLALGLPAAGQGYDHGRFRQHLELPGVWLDRGTVDGADAALLDGALGLAGHRVVGTLWFAAGAALAPARRDALLEAARARIDAVTVGVQASSSHDAAGARTRTDAVPVGAEAPSAPDPAGARARIDAASVVAGASSTHDPVVALRALAPRVEPLMALFQAVRGDWRRVAWGLEPNPPRIWRS